jgi:hypothetical protein
MAFILLFPSVLVLQYSFEATEKSFLRIEISVYAQLWYNIGSSSLDKLSVDPNRQGRIRIVLMIFDTGEILSSLEFTNRDASGIPEGDTFTESFLSSADVVS